MSREFNAMGELHAEFGTTPSSISTRFSRTALCAALFCVAVLPFGLTGCATGAAASPGAVESQAIAGRVMGGETPVVSSAVALYATSTSASPTIVNGTYVGNATLLASTTSDPTNGGWSFDPTKYTCPANQYAYIVSYGGNAGTGVNTNVLEVSMLGKCGALNGFTDVDEMTTVAAAYAFSSFMSINSSGAIPVVNITAPTANASTATTNDSSTAGSTSTTASGLQHAYLNAINLVNLTTGTAYAVPPSNPNAVAPQALLNTIGNILQACVNTSNVGGTSATCTKLFNHALSLSGTAPTNTLQAALNLARNPYAIDFTVTTGVTSYVSTLYSIVTPQYAFVPVLSKAPTDFSVAISYPVPANPSSGIGFPFTVALDPDDNVYVTSPETDIYVPNTSYTTASNSASACLFGFSSIGTLLPTVVAYKPGTTASIPGTPGNGTAGSSTWYCATGASTTNPTLFTQVAPDALGNVWIANLTPAGLNTSTTASENVMLKVTSSSRSTATSYISPGGYSPRAFVIDRENDVIFDENYAAGAPTQTMFCLTANGAGLPAYSIYGTPAGSGYCSVMPGSNSGNPTQSSNWIALDTSGTLWSATYADTFLVSGTAYPNYGGGFQSAAYVGSTGSNYYTGTWFRRNIDSGNSAQVAQENSAPFGIAMDSSGNPWVTLDAPQNGGTNTLPIGLVKGLVTGGEAATTSSSSTITTLGLVAPKWLESDGNNVLWIADTGGIVAYATAASPMVAEISQSGGFSPCLAGGAITCTYPDFANTKGIAIDSTGSVWFTTPDATTTVANSNRLIQIIGTASATWPMLGVGKPGTMPQ